MKDKSNGSSSLVKTVLIGFLVALILVQIVQPTIVIGDSMNDTYHDGDYLLLDKLSYRYNDPDYEDIIVFHVDDTLLIKRVIGKPGDTIQILDGKVYRNGVVLEESYTNQYTDPDMEITIKSGYFCMGDNRNNSLDSRFEEIGTVEKDKIVGKVLCRIFSAAKIKESLGY